VEKKIYKALHLSPSFRAAKKNYSLFMDLLAHAEINKPSEVVFSCPEVEVLQKQNTKLQAALDVAKEKLQHYSISHYEMCSLSFSKNCDCDLPNKAIEGLEKIEEMLK
jgi:hypothetical protein